MAHNSLLLGAHMSIAGGFEKAITRGESIGCTAIQVFTKSNRQWQAKPITSDEGQLFKKVWKSSSITSVIAHASYLINIGSSQAHTLAQSQQALIQELERCHLLGTLSLVIHPGSYTTGNETTCLQHIANSINHVLDRAQGNTLLLLETMAGQGSSTCYTLEQLAYVYNLITKKERVGICVDTCHLFAAGYDLRTTETYHAFWRSFDQILGLSLLKAIHLNDSKKGLGSYVDRHEDIGKGLLGIDTFRLLMNDPRLFAVPKILETPEKDPTLIHYAQNLSLLRSLMTEQTRTALGIER